MQKSRFNIWFNSHPMKVRLAVSFTLLFLLAVVIVTLLQSNLFMEDAKRQTETVFEQTATTYSALMDNLISGVNAVSKAPLYSTEIQDTLMNGTVLSASGKLRITQSTAALGQENHHHYVTILYDMNGRIVYSDVSSTTSYITKWDLEKIYSVAAKYHGKVFFMPIHDETHRYAFIAIRQIYSTSAYTPIGYTVIAVPKAAVENVLSDKANGIFSNIILYNGEGTTIYSHNAEAGVPEELSSFGENINSIIKTEHYITHYSVSWNNTYQFLLYASKNTLMQKFYTTRNLLLGISAVIALIAVGIVILLSSNITKPLRSITDLMEKVQQGDLSVKFHALYKDEVGTLGNSFNIMLEKLQLEMKHVATAEAEKRQVQIDALKQQINPHFIYNTMETFRMMALEEEQYDLSELIACFGKIMRYNITYINELTTVEQEIQYLKYYLRIQNIRYNNRIQLNCNIEPGMEQQKLIRLQIQPVVENSILHGMIPEGSQPIHIILNIYRHEDACVLEISDDGVGIQGDRLLMLQKEISRSYMQASESNSIGLRNIRERIELYYGSPYGISIDSIVQAGTVIRILIPLDLA